MDDSTAAARTDAPADVAPTPAPTPAPAPAERRRRPRDRRRQIEAAAAVAFAQRGYHGVSMQEVAHAVGISAPALYRHFPNKYVLFSTSALALAHGLVEATDEAATGGHADPASARRELGDILAATISTTIDSRASGGIYRWEGRYLTDDDRARLHDDLRTLRHRVADPLAVLRPDASPELLDLASRAALSAIASITTHRTAAPTGAIRSLLADTARRSLTVDPAPADDAPPIDAEGPGVRPRRRKDLLVQAAISLFAERGYHEVTIEDIARAVDLTPSGVYRHFAGKSDLLRAACEQAAAVLAAAADDALAREHPADALATLSNAYLRFAVRDRELMDVYTAEVAALDPDDQRRLRTLQRNHVAEWVEVLRRVRPELSARDAKFLVHAGFNVVADLSVTLRREDPAEAIRRIRPFLNAALGA
ncbi:TetR/AcrR family transcriptional regulator [Agromyces larvae]|uniref:TetR/AcrR family transcriptional regulator n=1 Tax=Agromyces larvae TaxID=2929802 RepID=A0ABY4BVX9_9MICO|nr:TetR/AcrR family transcriptional regulator [Agromyces larvae]UOE43059.1 TetR/AcrR family transcriptional regulator [Agromyces larvae]